MKHRSTQRPGEVGALFNEEACWCASRRAWLLPKSKGLGKPAAAWPSADAAGCRAVGICATIDQKGGLHLPVAPQPASSQAPPTATSTATSSRCRHVWVQWFGVIAASYEVQRVSRFVPFASPSTPNTHRTQRAAHTRAEGVATAASLVDKIVVP